MTLDVSVVGGKEFTVGVVSFLTDSNVDEDFGILVILENSLTDPSVVSVAKKVFFNFLIDFSTFQLSYFIKIW